MKLFYAIRLLKGKKRIMTGANWLSFIGIFLGVLTLLIVSSVMNGLRQNMLSIIIGAKSDIQVHSRNYDPIQDYESLQAELKSNFSDVYFAPVCTGEFVLKNKSYIAPTFCYGIQPKSFQNVSSMLSTLRLGNVQEKAFEENGIVLGMDIALALHVSVGDYIDAFTPTGTKPTMFGFMPNSKKLKVIGIFISDMPVYNELFSYISLSNAQALLNYKENEATMIQTKIKQSENAKMVASNIEKMLPKDLIAEPWTSFESGMYTAMKIEKVVMSAVLLLMILLSVFNFIGSTLKRIAQKKEEIAILKAIGTSSNWIEKRFLSSSILLSFSASFIASSIAFALITSQVKYRWIPLPMMGFPIDYLPMEFLPIDFLWIPGFTIFITFFATLYPMKRIQKLDVMEIMRER